MKYLVIGLIVAVTALAALLRQKMWPRLLVLAIVAPFALALVNVNQSAALMAERAAIKKTGEKPSAQWIEGAEAANRFTREWNHIGMAIGFALVVLTLVPVERQRKSQPPPGN